MGEIVDMKGENKGKSPYEECLGGLRQKKKRVKMFKYDRNKFVEA